MYCPCGSQQTYSTCCKLFIEHVKKPETAEQLMRSRYSAYATGEYQYILDTYTEDIKTTLTLDDLSESAAEQKWVKLTIHSSDERSTPATVEFSAFYLIGNELFELRENSRFFEESGSIRYKDGDIKVSDKILTIKRNDPCPCDSGIKFKKCCNN
jgi:SEC-C motif domain protein